MASIAFRNSGFLALKGDLDMDTIVVKATLCMSSYSASVNDAEVADVTLDEMDGGYDGAFGGTDRATLSPAVVQDTSARVDLESGAAATTWTSLAAGTRSVQGVHVYKHLTSDALSPNIAFCDFGTAVAANGQDFIVNWDAGSSQDMMRWTFT